MPFHLGAFIENIDSAGVFANLAAAQDDRLFTQLDDIRVPLTLNQVIGLAGGADGVVAPRLRLTSPTLVQMTRYEVAPLNSQDAAGVEPDDIARYVDLSQTPLILGPDEILNAELNNNPAAVQDQWCLVWFSDGPVSAISGRPIFTVRATGTTTLVDITWTSVTIILDDNLPPGNYQVVGLRPESAGCVAGRVVFRTADQWRPGALGTDLITDIQPPIFRAGRLGVWGEFPFTQTPAIEFLSVIADTAEVVHLDLIRT